MSCLSPHCCTVGNDTRSTIPFDQISQVYNKPTKPPQASHFLALQKDMLPLERSLNEMVSSGGVGCPSVTPSSSLDELAVKSLVSSTIPDFTLQGVKHVNQVRVLRQFKAESLDGRLVLVNISPPFLKGLTTRGERDCVRSEAALLSWLTSNDKDSAETSPVVGSSSKTLSLLHQPGTRELSFPRGIRDNWTGSYQERLLRSFENPKQFKQIERLNREGYIHRISGPHNLQSYLPHFVEHGALQQLKADYMEYNVLIPTQGNPIATLEQPLNAGERKSIDRQIGRLVRRIGSLTSPTQRFGVPTQVLNYPCSKEVIRREPALMLMRNVGWTTWSDAFGTLLEEALADVEDSGVPLSYVTIRSNMERFKWTLNAVKEARLVAIDVGDDTNVVVERGSKLSTNLGKPGGKQQVETGDNIQVTGLTDWSMCVFGDPLLAAVFNENPGSAFWEGFEESIPDNIPGSSGDAESIEDRSNAHVRLLLYEMYHSLSQIAQDYCRRTGSNDAKAMEGRKRLSRALVALMSLDDHGQPKSDGVTKYIPYIPKQRISTTKQDN